MLKWAAIPALLVAAACQDEKADSDLASDLALVAGSDIELANASGPNALVISAVENIPAPSPRTTPTPSTKRGTKAPPPEQLMVDVAAAEPDVTVHEIMTVSASDTPVAAETPAPEAPPVIRPHPIEPRYPVGSGSVYGTGRDEGVGSGPNDGTNIGGVTVVIRGGRSRRDPCAIHDRNGRPAGGPGVLINTRIPTSGTFPRY
jgi:hypothetical protein